MPVEQQYSILESFLKDHVKLKTGIIQLLHYHHHHPQKKQQHIYIYIYAQIQISNFKYL